MRCVLAVLLLEAGRPVPVRAIIDRVWDGHEPCKARNNLQTYVARLRRQLESAAHEDARCGSQASDVRLSHRSGVYVLDTEPERVDLYRFRRLREEARALLGSDDEEAVRLLRQATGLWRGPALADLTGGWAERVRLHLEEERLSAVVERIEAELRLGRHADVVTELSHLVEEHPFQEPLAGLLMLALYRCGRQADALACYRRTRRILVDELGQQPGPELQELHQRILRRDPELAPPRRPAVAPVPRLNNLLRDIPEFTGREQEMSRLLSMAAGERQPADTAVAIEAIDGMAGVGKTTLAVHAAHLLSDRYPDAQLYLNLRAHDPAQRALEPVAALDALLRALGVPAERIPPTLEERAALWRAQLASRRALVVLDDAAGQEQLQPLLPGAPGCLVLITSRRRIAGLAGVRSFSLDVFPVADAVALFTRIVGADRAQDTATVEEVVRLCGYLPLAIQLVANWLYHRPAWTVADLRDRLAKTQHRLGEMRSDRRHISAAFDLSYRDLTEDVQRAFRQLGLHPGPDFAAPAAAALLGRSLDETEAVLEELFDLHLLEEPARGRYRFHDLIHEYARDLALRLDSAEDRRAAVRRLLDHYLRTADRADRLLYPHRRRIDLDVEHQAAYTQPLTTWREAQAWLEEERANLLSAVRYASEHGWPGYAARLPHVLASFLETSGHWPDAAEAHTLALAAWDALGDRTGRARALCELGLICWRTGRYREALECAEEALARYRSAGDRWGEGEALDLIGRVYWHRARFREALERFREALSVRREVGDRRGEAETLNCWAAVQSHLGNHQEALDLFQRLLTIHRSIGERRGELKALNNIGDVLQALGRYDEALEHYRQGLAIVQEIGGRQYEAILLNNIGNIHRHAGRPDSALDNYRRALSLYRELGDRRCEADTLINLGAAYLGMDRHTEALSHYEEGLAVARAITERLQEAAAQRGIGDVYRRLGRFQDALARYQEVLAITREIEVFDEQARALYGLGEIALRTDGPAAARVHLEKSLALFERLGVPEAETVRSRLRALTGDDR